MLQQTTVATVGPYYQKFLKRWATIEALAEADLEEVLQQWAGLGYYRRARGLHQCAKIICADYAGKFPEDYAALIKLPGFGAYTAAAVMAIGFNQRANVVDGNVERVVARWFNLATPLPKAKSELCKLAETLLPEARYGDYAQALMDLGATVCTPRSPKCELCPINTDCKGRIAQTADSLPRREKAKPKPLRRGIAFFVSNHRGEIFLRYRPENGLLAKMLEVPSTHWLEGKMPVLAKALGEAPLTGDWRLLDGLVSHTFTHFKLELRVAVAKVKRTSKTLGNCNNGYWIAPNKLDQQALPSLMHKVIRHALAEEES